PAGQQHLLRPGRRRVDQEHRQGAHVREARQGRHGVGQLLPRGRHDDAVRRLQDVGPGARERRGRARPLHREQDGQRAALLSWWYSFRQRKGPPGTTPRRASLLLRLPEAHNSPRRTCPGNGPARRYRVWGPSWTTIRPTRPTSWDGPGPATRGR